MKRLIALLPALLPGVLCAQGSIGLRGSWGWLSPHHVHMWYLVERHAIMGEVFYQRHFSGAKAWHHDYRDPSWGVGLMATDAGSPDLVGRVVRLLPYFDLPFHSGPKGSIGLRFGWGLGLVRYPHDLETNNQQTAIGSRVNTAVLIALEARRSIGRYQVGFNVALDHLSNASLEQPNLGINLVTAGLSVQRSIAGGHARPAAVDTSASYTKDRSTEVFLAWASQEVERYEGGHYPVFSASASMMWRITAKSSFGGGIDVFNKAVLRVRDSELSDVPRIELTQIGLHGGYRLHFGGLAIVVEQGVYVHTPVDEETALYQRIGMRQDLSPHLAASLTLKTHFGSADHFELGLGYRF